MIGISVKHPDGSVTVADMTRRVAKPASLVSLDQRSRLVRPQTFTPPTNPVVGYYIDTETGIRYYYNGLYWFRVNGIMLVPLGDLSALVINEKGIWPYPKVTISGGDIVTVNATYSYSGPAVTGAEEYVAIGVEGTFGFTEVVNFQQLVSLSSSTTPYTKAATIQVTIPAGMAADANDIFFRVRGGTPIIPEQGVMYTEAFNVLQPTPTVTNVDITNIYV